MKTRYKSEFAKDSKGIASKRRTWSPDWGGNSEATQPRPRAKNMRQHFKLLCIPEVDLMRFKVIAKGVKVVAKF